MKALGLIETRGLIAAIESADAMLKAADVCLLERSFVGGGLVTIAVTGDVGAIKAAVDAGSAAVRQLDMTLLVSEHVIPRPHEELSNTILSSETLEDEKILPNETIPPGDVPEELQIEKALELDVDDTESDENAVHLEETDFNEMHKEDLDQLVLEVGLEEAIEVLTKLRVVKLRNLAREYKEFGVAGRLISKADKNMLLTEFLAYYKQN